MMEMWCGDITNIAEGCLELLPILWEWLAVVETVPRIQLQPILLSLSLSSAVLAVRVVDHATSASIITGMINMTAVIGRPLDRFGGIANAFQELARYLMKEVIFSVLIDFHLCWIGRAP